MGEFLRALLGLDEAEPDRGPSVDRRLVAAAALMVEAALLDGNFAAAERRRILELLEQHFELDSEQASRLVAEAEAQARDSVDFHRFTAVIKDGFGHDGRLEIIEMLWEVAYADGKLDDYEASLLRRVTGLLYIPDQESGAVRKRVMTRLGIPGP